MVYLDNAATTALLPAVQQALREATEVTFGNPSSAHSLGAAAARGLEQARCQVAHLLGAAPQEVIFTSGGTEANALAVLGAARARARQRHVVVTAIEHPSVLRNCERLEAEGFKVTLVQPEPNGVVSPHKLLLQITPHTGLVAMMLVNSELGTRQPVEAVGQMLLQLPHAPHFHVDAVQAAAWLPLAAKAMGATSLALAGHKLHAPKGTGALWLRKGARLQPLWEGGGQELGLRSGTQNVSALMAFAKACAMVTADKTSATQAVATLRDRFERAACDDVVVQATVPHDAPRAPHISSLRFANLPAEPLLHALESRGVLVAAGSACSSKKPERSHVLKAIGVPQGDAVLRFSLSRLTTEAEVDKAAAAVGEAVREIASMTNLLAFGSRRSSRKN